MVIISAHLLISKLNTHVFSNVFVMECGVVVSLFLFPFKFQYVVQSFLNLCL